jgi:hypothetical protein
MTMVVLFIVLLFGGSFIAAKVLDWLRVVGRDVVRFVVGVVRWFV